MIRLSVFLTFDVIQQGYFHHGVVACWRGCEGSEDHLEESDQVSSCAANSFNVWRLRKCLVEGVCFLFTLSLRIAQFFVSVIFCEATAIYGVIVAIILQTKIEYVPQNPDGSYPGAAVFSGYGVFGSGITVGLANLVCGCASSLNGRRRAIPLTTASERSLSSDSLILTRSFPCPGSAWGLLGAAAPSPMLRTRRSS